jgi:hypothetical protein
LLEGLSAFFKIHTRVEPVAAKDGRSARFQGKWSDAKPWLRQYLIKSGRGLELGFRVQAERGHEIMNRNRLSGG